MRPVASDVLIIAPQVHASLLVYVEYSSNRWVVYFMTRDSMLKFINLNNLGLRLLAGDKCAGGDATRAAIPITRRFYSY